MRETENFTYCENREKHKGIVTQGLKLRDGLNKRIDTKVNKILS